MMKVLITGGAGFIGSNFINYLLKTYDNNIRIANIDKLTYAGNLKNLDNIKHFTNYTLHEVDICNKILIKEIFTEFDPDYVINFAAESHVDKSITNPDIFVQTNVLGTQVLLNASLNFSVEKYIQVSTDEVYGSLGPFGYFTEKTPIDPNSPYSASKAAADLLTKAYHETYNLPVNITRCSNNYGPYQFPEKLIPLTILNCLSGKKIPVYGNGLNVRDWLHVEDHCTAIDAVLNKGKSGEVYNIGGNNEWTNIDIVKLILRQMSEILPESGISEELIEYVEDRKGHDWRYAIDSAKIQNKLGWKPQVKFEEGIRKTIYWYLDNREWLNSAIDNNILKETIQLQKRTD